MKQRGFTFIEVMLATVIFAFGAVGILRGYVTAMNAYRGGEITIEAVGLLKQKMAEIEKQAIEGAGLAQTAYGQDRCLPPYEDFQWTIEVCPSEYTGLNHVRITVFNDQVKPVRTVSLVGYVENRE